MSEVPKDCVVDVRKLGDMMVDGRLLQHDADQVQLFAEFLRVSGPPVRPGEMRKLSLEGMKFWRDHWDWIGISEKQRDDLDEAIKRREHRDQRANLMDEIRPHGGTK